MEDVVQRALERADVEAQKIALGAPNRMGFLAVHLVRAVILEMRRGREKEE